MGIPKDEEEDDPYGIEKKMKDNKQTLEEKLDTMLKEEFKEDNDSLLSFESEGFLTNLPIKPPSNHLSANKDLLSLD